MHIDTHAALSCLWLRCLFPDPFVVWPVRKLPARISAEDMVIFIVPCLVGRLLIALVHLRWLGLVVTELCTTLYRLCTILYRSRWLGLVVTELCTTNDVMTNVEISAGGRVFKVA